MKKERQTTIKDTLHNVAVKMLRLGFSTNEIAESTGLSLEEIETLQSKE